jgi:hypothetical protein
MGLLSALKNRFFAPELCRVAKAADVAATAECIGRSSVVVIGADLGNSVPLNPEHDAVLAIVEAAAQKKSFEGSVHKYEIDGETFLPIFTDPLAAESFCGAYVSLLNRIHAFRIFRVPGAYIGRWIAGGDVLVVNPQNNNEVEIDRAKSQAIRARLPGTDGFADAQFVSLALPMPGVSRPIEFTPDTYVS